MSEPTTHAAREAEFERALAAVRAAVDVNDGDTLARLSPDSTVIWTASGSWSKPASVTLGDLRALAARPATQGAWSLEPEGKPIQGFSNRAGETDTDDAIASELEAAGIEVYRGEFLREISGEVKTAVRGSLHGWQFERAWYYWMAKGPGIELAAADVLYAAHPETVRVNGHCGCPSPREQNNGLAIGSYHVDSPAGLKGLADTIKAIVAQSAPPSSGQESAR